MCSIMGYCGKSMPVTTFQKGFDKTISRGPDDTRIINTGNGLLGFHRLAIMGLQPEGMQPFFRDGNYLVCNGEIYGFRKWKKQLEEKGYQFQSESDCEILLPLYQEYGVEMFQKLDAEFALILYDGKQRKYLAARDPIGIRPLFYGKDGDGAMLFASEAKNLVGLCNKITPFPPGYYYDGEQFVCYHDITKVDSFCNDDLETICKNIREKLITGIEKRLDSDAPLGFLLSGGLDSSLVCSVAAKLLQKPIETFAIGMDTDAIDLKYAKEVADFIGSNHHEVIITKEDVINALPEVIALLGTYDITTIRASIGMYLVCKAIHEQTDIRVLLTGEISDELFGYKYTDFAPNPQEFQKESEKRIREIYCYDVLRADRCISVNSLEARVPFGDLDFVQYVMSIDPQKKMNTYGKGKYLLRHAFEGDFLPNSILMREKAAFSDAVGHSMVDDLKAYAEEQYSDECFEKGCKKYTYATPFTKESLLYRDLFEQYYPGQVEMIPGFWMPNKKWEGCDVADPSARVLSNYGDSGK
ncbi:MULTISPECIES: asparagine synthase B [Clostridiaceae]|uniref:asparagine synthase (glutamine-hydrolyzing) n=1 Tax=Clostridium facile TaxID=2763035 RepID=A0ABR7IR73_9CLOT|nr:MULTISPECIES: asparagine synthase B [Clostridiaceae]MBC5787637.1 asparagine synthase B [Clostridium facile]PWM99727.1 MAG: asparagine synthase B [Massilioclostridium sp.]